VNGGVPWPKGFSQIERQRQAAGNWVAPLRGLYRFLPFARSTFAKATAIIAASSHVCGEFTKYRDKVFYVPGESGVNPAWLQEAPDRQTENASTLELLHVARLVPYKACDLALRGAAALLREGRARLTIIGEGPERPRLESLVDELGVRRAVTFCGMLPNHSDVLAQFKRSDVFLFPSLREFGGTVVFEALAFGAVPVVADYGGPGDIVTDQVGYRIPLTDERHMAQQIESVLTRLASDRSHLEMLRQQGPAYARERLSWESKARMVTQVLLWAVGTSPKPSMPPPKPHFLDQVAIL
jgi:glycosyltransferase involved in cell wall biosynthesis